MKIFARSKKKAALSLSMEAIVILIIAVVMLGLGLGFVRNIFGSMNDQNKKVLTISELQDPPSEDKPLTVTPSQVTVKEGGGEERVQVAFYNPSPTKTAWKIKISNADTTYSTWSSLMVVTYASAPFLLPKNKITGYNLIFKAKNGLVEGIIPGAAASSETQATTLFSVTVCSVAAPAGGAAPAAGADCESSNPETYQKEVVVTARK